MQVFIPDLLSNTEFMLTVQAGPLRKRDNKAVYYYIALRGKNEVSISMCVDQDSIPPTMQLCHQLELQCCRSNPSIDMATCLIDTNNKKQTFVTIMTVFGSDMKSVNATSPNLCLAFADCRSFLLVK